MIQSAVPFQHHPRAISAAASTAQSFASHQHAHGGSAAAAAAAANSFRHQPSTYHHHQVSDSLLLLLVLIHLQTVVFVLAFLRSNRPDNPVKTCVCFFFWFLVYAFLRDLATVNTSA